MRSYIAGWIVVAFALSFVVLSVWFTHHLTSRFATVEQERMEVWAEATRQLVMADEKTDISFYSSIIAANTTIPVYMTNADYEVILTRNVKAPAEHPEAFYARKIAHLRETQTPIEVNVSPDVKQYIFYEQSDLLRQLRLFPLVQMLVLIAFAALLVTYIITSYRNEQNRVWVGLTKETAHQLGTPISSLNGWLELLKANYPDEAILSDIDTDIRRLQMVAERFSKIGSRPALQPVDMSRVVEESFGYMRSRVSNKVDMQLIIDPSLPTEDCQSSIVNRQSYLTQADAPLMKWVIENLIKNAVDAMNGRGSLTLHLFRQGNRLVLDVTDTGKGIGRKHLRQIFRPGFTTKQRGWGLGLSLCKRIVEDYHRGKIFVLSSTVGEGTTFRLMFKQG